MTSIDVSEINAFLEDNKDQALELLKELVNIDSFSYDKEGVNKVGAVIQKKLREFEIPFIVRHNEDFGDHIIATIKGEKDGKILLMGHQDTPHPPGTVQERPYTEDDGKAYGPGVSDMKAGLVYMIYAAKALSKFALKDICDIELLFTPEEEIGSPVSKAVIEERAKDAFAVFCLESARPDGSCVIKRKGSAHMRFEIEGKAAHAGAFIKDGISAIDELAHKIIHFKELMDEEKGVTVNVGKISGGISNNMVAPHASGTIHSSFWRLKDFEELYKELEKIINTSYIAGTKSSITDAVKIVPMECTEGVSKLYDIVKEAGDLIDVPIDASSTMGAADSGTTATMGIPTICAMGPVGGKWHAEGEYMVLDTFLPRMQLLASSMLLAIKKL